MFQATRVVAKIYRGNMISKRGNKNFYKGTLSKHFYSLHSTFCTVLWLIMLYITPKLFLSFLGRGAPTMGHFTNRGKFLIDAAKFHANTFRCPDLTGFSLKAYVARNTPKI